MDLRSQCSLDTLPTRHPILTFTQYRWEEYIDGTMVPVCWTSAESFWTAFFFVTIILLFFFIPLAILMILYTIIARTLMDHPSILLHTSKNNNVPSHTTLIYRKQVVLMLGTVVLAFFICLLPFRAFTLWVIIVPPEKLVALGIEGYYYLLFFCRIMFHLNSAINPILYNLMSSKFRDGFLKLCGVKKRKIKRFIIRRTDHSKLDRKNTYTNTSISNSTTHTHVTDSFWRRYSSRNASEKSFRGGTTTTTTNSGTPTRKNIDSTNNSSSLSVSAHGSPNFGYSGVCVNSTTELRASSFVRKSNSSLSKRFGPKMEESYV